MSAVSQPELYKDKIEVSLDGRQIFYLFFGGAVLVGMVFVLGVMVGRRVESRSHVDQIGRPERASNDPLAALDALEGKKLTFPGALVKAPIVADKPEVENKIDQIEQVRADKPADPPKADKKKPDDKKLDKTDKTDKTDKAKSEPVTKPEQVKTEQAKVDKPKKSDDKKKLDAAPINGDVVTASDDKKIDDTKIVAKKPDEKGKFTLQLSSFQDKHEAEAFLSSVKSSGYPAYITETEISGKGTFYRVRLGTYRSLEAANDAKADVEKTLKKTASVMPR
jgi:DedD protein